MKVVLIILSVSIGLFTIGNLHNYYAYFWKAESAVVLLKSCESICELRGTYSIEPWTGKHIVSQENGSRIVLTEGSFVSVSYPSRPKP